MLRIIHIIPSLQKGGAERICLDICNELSIRENIEVKIIVLDSTNEYEFLSKGLDIACITDTVSLSILRKNKINLTELNKIVADFQPNVIHSHLYLAEIFIKHLQNKDISLFYQVHDNNSQLERKKIFSLRSKKDITNFYERRIYNSLLKKSKTTFLCISKDTFNYIKNNLDYGAHILFPNAITINTFKTNKERKLDSIKLITIGSLVEKKGHDFLIDVVIELKKITNLKIELKIIGGGPMKEKLQNKIDRLNLKDNIKLIGKVDHPEDYLKSSNLYIHGATIEPFGLVLLEAMASGLPVLSTDGFGNRDLIINNYNGYLFPDRDKVKFANTIAEIYNNSEKHNKLSKNSFEFSKKYDIKPYVDKLIKLYQKNIENLD